MEMALFINSSFPIAEMDVFHLFFQQFALARAYTQTHTHAHTYTHRAWLVKGEKGIIINCNVLRVERRARWGREPVYNCVCNYKKAAMQQQFTHICSKCCKRKKHQVNRKTKFFYRYHRKHTISSLKRETRELLKRRKKKQSGGYNKGNKMFEVLPNQRWKKSNVEKPKQGFFLNRFSTLSTHTLTLRSEICIYSTWNFDVLQDGRCFSISPACLCLE